MLADTNNLSERWKTASGSRPKGGGRRPSVGMTDDAGGRRGDHSTGTSGRIPLSDSHLLGHRAVPGSVTHNLRGPSHTPKGHKEAHRRAYALTKCSGVVGDGHRSDAGAWRGRRGRKRLRGRVGRGGTSAAVRAGRIRAGLRSDPPRCPVESRAVSSSIPVRSRSDRARSPLRSGAVSGPVSALSAAQRPGPLLRYGRYGEGPRAEVRATSTASAARGAPARRAHPPGAR